MREALDPTAKARFEHTWAIREQYHLREFAEAEGDAARADLPEVVMARTPCFIEAFAAPSGGAARMAGLEPAWPPASVPRA
ncbi:MAG: hypothetical protein ACLPUG_07705 [Acidimicrobiales bacterium]